MGWSGGEHVVDAGRLIGNGAKHDGENAIRGILSEDDQSVFVALLEDDRGSTTQRFNVVLGHAVARYVFDAPGVPVEPFDAYHDSGIVDNRRFFVYIGSLLYDDRRRDMAACLSADQPPPRSHAKLSPCPPPDALAPAAIRAVRLAIVRSFR